MKTAIVFLLGGVLLIALFLWSVHTNFRRTSIDIHISDTYYIVSYLQFVLINTLILGFVFSIGGIISTQFKSRSFLILTLVFALVSFLVYHYFASQFEVVGRVKSFVSEPAYHS